MSNYGLYKMDKLFKTNFYPGPSRVYDKIKSFSVDAFDKGILSLNHRSAIFEEMYRLAKDHLFEKLAVPENYHLVFVSSATECWEIIAQSLIAEKSTHVYNGSFGEKWFDYTKLLHPKADAFPFSVDTLLKPEEMEIALESEWICLTQNETSNGTQVHDEALGAIRRAFPDQFIAVDATSSLGGIELTIAHADLWFASVQKCLGLPPGLGLLIFSDDVIQKAKEIDDKKYYNSFLRLVENEERNQTQYTPNILGIYQLFRLAESLPPIVEIDSHITTRARHLYNYFQGFSEFQPISQNSFCFSDTVLAFEGEATFVAQLKKEALRENILLGNGYGKWKSNSFRIANFPAIPDSEFDVLIKFFDANSDN